MLGLTEVKTMNIICRLSSSHAIMSFIVRVGPMKGSGIEQAVKTVYGFNTIYEYIPLADFSTYGSVQLSQTLL